jgi:hypothetical protein
MDVNDDGMIDVLYATKSAGLGVALSPEAARDVDDDDLYSNDEWTHLRLGENQVEDEDYPYKYHRIAIGACTSSVLKKI